MFNRKYIFNILGILLVFESLFMLVPAIISLIYKDGTFFSFVGSAAITMVVGGLTWLGSQNPEPEMGKREGYFITASSWIVFSLFGSLPFLFSHQLTSFSDAFFESISGFTATGATCVPNVENLPHAIILWRSMTHLMGGIGILVLCIVVMPIFGTGSMYIYSAETSSVASNKLQPKIKGTALRLLTIYLGLIVVETVLLLLGKMNLFDALCYSFGTISSGSFAPHTSSIADFPPYIQYVIGFFMLSAAINFNLYYFLLKKNFSKVFKNEEFRLFWAIFAAVVIVIALSLYFSQDYDSEKSFRFSFVTVASIISTTGFTNTDYNLWTPFTWFLLLLLMFIGGCAGSTSGSIKVVRYLLLFKNIPTQFKKLLHERGVIALRLNGEFVREELIFRTLAFFMIYLLVWAASTVILLITGLPFIDSLGGTASCMAGCGPAFGSLGPTGNYAHIHDVAKWVLSFDMLVGRLELFSFLILFTAYFWKNK